MHIGLIAASDVRRRRALFEYSRHLADLGCTIDIIGPAAPGEDIQAQIPHARFLPVTAPAVSQFSLGSAITYVRAALAVLPPTPYTILHVNAFRGCGLLPLWGRRHAHAWLVDIRSSNVSSAGWKAVLADRLTTLETAPYERVLIHDAALGRQMLGTRPYTTIPPGADLQKFTQGARSATRQALGLDDRDTVIVYTGALTHVRRPQQILTTFALLAAQRPRLKLLLVGESDHQAQLDAWVSTHGLTAQVTFTGNVPYERIQDYVAAADIGFAYVPATVNFENNPPLKTAEFLAAGLPTVATNTAGNRIYITDGENGLLAADEPAALAQALGRLLDDPALTARLRAQARPSIMAFDWQAIVRDQLFPVYQTYTAP
jgi:glycosyltransferase involved in cell wall biosynthesis